MQLALMGHDVGHRLLAHSATGDGFIGVIITIFLGVGVGWWKSQHNVCHPTFQTLSHIGAGTSIDLASRNCSNRNKHGSKISNVSESL
jgi:hypothetical protein